VRNTSLVLPNRKTFRLIVGVTVWIGFNAWDLVVKRRRAAFVRRGKKPPWEAGMTDSCPQISAYILR